MGEDTKVRTKNAPVEKARVQSARYREIIPKLLSKKTPIKKISECGKDGDMKFYVDAKELGINYDEFYQYVNEIFTPFVADFLGELLVRENLDLFVPHLTQFKPDEFVDAISGGEENRQHKRFGMKINRGEIEFRFQASFLHDILVEEFKLIVV